MLNKILITDPLSNSGLKILQDSGFEVLYKPKLSEDELSAIISDIDGWIIRSGTTIRKKHIQDAKKLQIIGRAGVGTDNIDIKSATQEGIIVMNVPDGNTISAAEHTMAMLLALSRNVYKGHMDLINGQWNRHKLVGNELRNKTLGVVGLGKIGREVIKRSIAYDMKIIGYDPYVKQEQFNKEEVTIVSLDDLIKDSDFITLHLPINDNTRNLFDYERISQMKNTARLINVARGGIVNEDDLAKALNNNIISGAAIDVFVNEPISDNHVLLHAKNILLTPHLGASTFEAKEGVSISVCNQISEYFLKNKLSNVLNMPISDSTLMSKLSSYYKLSELMGSIQSQLIDSSIDKIEILCFGDAEDSKSIGLSFIKGILSGVTDDRINFINAATIAEERGIVFQHSHSTDKIAFNNKIQSIVYTDGNKFTLTGNVYNDNFIRITEIMGFEVDLKPEGIMLFIKNKDIPGVVGKIGTILGKESVNISGYLLSKIENKEFAYSIIKIDEKINNEVLLKLNKIDEIIDIKQLDL